MLVVLPSWVGDVAMATPTLRALRGLYPAAHISLLVKSYVAPVIETAPWHDRIFHIRTTRRTAGSASNRRRTTGALAARLRHGNFDLAVLLPNSFRSAVICKMAGIERRLGYDRDGRGLLLTDRLLPMKTRGQYTPVSAVDYYLGLARYLGAAGSDPRMELFTRPEDDARATAMLDAAGVDRTKPIVMINPGAANHGDAKLWPAARFAAAADRIISAAGATVLVNGSPKERAILDEVHAAASHPLVDLPRLGSNLTLLKSLVRQCNLMITNDTGARHIAAAFDVPLISLFGPTDPRWTALEAHAENIIRFDVDCPACRAGGRGEHICMTAIGVEAVVQAALRQLNVATDR